MLKELSPGAEGWLRQAVKIAIKKEEEYYNEGVPVASEISSLLDALEEWMEGDAAFLESCAFNSGSLLSWPAGVTTALS